jgi:hypothetical protein
MPRGKRLCGLAAPATALALPFTGAGAADNSTTLPYENAAQNECNGEEVAVEGTIHMEEHSTITANGTHFQLTINDLRYYLRLHMTVNANGIPTVDRTESSLECR